MKIFASAEIHLNPAKRDITFLSRTCVTERYRTAPAVYHNGKKLEVKKNYTVEYPDTSAGAYKEAGDYVIRINGKGNYTGNREILLHLYEDKKLISRIQDYCEKNNYFFYISCLL